MKLSNEQIDFILAALSYYMQNVIDKLPLNDKAKYYRLLWQECWEKVGEE